MSARAQLRVERRSKERVLTPEEKRRMGNSVHHPGHYNQGQFEVIDVIEDWKLNFNLGNCVKYVTRAEHKGKTLEDLRKGLWYLQREIKRLEKAQ